LKKSTVCGNDYEKPVFLFVLLQVVMAGCKLKAAPDASQADARSFNAHGVVRQIAADLHSVTIQHKAIAGYMPAMTMDFPVKDTNELAGISPSDEISFKLLVRENGDWVEGIHFIAHLIENVTNNTYIFHVPSAELEQGDLLPDYEFTTENGGKIRFSDFRGQAV
jgi:protein SCO1